METPSSHCRTAPAQCSPIQHPPGLTPGGDPRHQPAPGTRQRSSGKQKLVVCPRSPPALPFHLLDNPEQLFFTSCQRMYT